MELEQLTDKIRLSHSGRSIHAKLKVGGSKSISNRVLILNALSEVASPISNLSDSDDTQTLVQLLSSDKYVLDAHHAGTTFRFMTAYLALVGGEKILTGSARMKQRPIGPLVDALRDIGAEIAYVENDGYPPLKIGKSLQQRNDHIEIAADMSSQFISALCMIAPKLPLGLTIKLVGELVSEPYLRMTLKLMQAFGVESQFDNQLITIRSQDYISAPFTVESDWSSASYPYAIAAIAKDAKIQLSYFKESSVQADSIIQTFSEDLGVKGSLRENTLTLESTNQNKSELEHDFLTHPDIAQTVAAIAAAKNIKISYSGLKTLAIKETDRVVALQQELNKVGVKIAKTEDGNSEYVQSGAAKVELPEFETYQDHRMAMALAPLALLGPIEIINPKVVSKSYPNFWKDLTTLGFVIEPLD